MIRTFSFPVTEDHITIADFLRRKGCTQRLLATLKRTDQGILHNGIPTDNTGIRLAAGDTVTIHIEENESSEKIAPLPLPIHIVYEDEDILVVNKDPGVPVHPSQGNHDNTLANGLAYYYAQKNQPFVFRCINRLDRNTSGLILLAKHPLSAGILSRQMMQRGIHRTYRALVAGFTEPEGTIDLPIGRKEGSIIERKVDTEHGAPAVTHYRTIAHFQEASLIELHLDTGRTHQIRVHMTSIGHPLLGDALYYPTDPSPLTRQALHSYELTFTHPITGQPCRFTAPMPEDISCIFEKN